MTKDIKKKTNSIANLPPLLTLKQFKFLWFRTYLRNLPSILRQICYDHLCVHPNATGQCQIVDCYFSASHTASGVARISLFMVSPLLRTICSIVCTSPHAHLSSVLAPHILSVALLLPFTHISLLSVFHVHQSRVPPGGKVSRWFVVWKLFLSRRGRKRFLYSSGDIWKANSLLRKLNLFLSLRSDGSATYNRYRWSVFCLCFLVIRWNFLPIRGGDIPLRI